jgi:Flp pilus assembly protein TadD/DNA-binding transcriptional MerR regulator
MKSYSLAEIAGILGIDERQLHRFAHKGLIDPKLSNDKTARFTDIDCIRLKTIKQADELGYEPEAIFRLIGKTDEVLAAEDPTEDCEEFAMAMYRQIYDELNDCEPLEQLNKQCDLRLLIDYIKNLKELRGGAAPSRQKPKSEVQSKSSSTAKGVKASMGGTAQAADSAPSPSIRPYSVAKYWEYMKKVEELQKEVASDSGPDDETLHSPPSSLEDTLESLPAPGKLKESFSGPSEFEDHQERTASVTGSAKLFDKQQSWGVWFLAGLFLTIVTIGYFWLSSPNKEGAPARPAGEKNEAAQTAATVEETSPGRQPPEPDLTTTEIQASAPPTAAEVASQAPETAEAAPQRAPAMQTGLEVGDLSLWYDGLNNIYRADFTIANRNADTNGEPVSGYVFVYLRFDDETSNPKSLLLPSGEIQTSKPVQIRNGARFAIRRFKKMELSSIFDMPPSDIVFSNVLVYSREGELLLEKAFEVSVRPFISASGKQTASPKPSEEESLAPPSPIQPIEPGPPPVAVPDVPTSDLKETAAAPPSLKPELAPPAAIRSGTGTEASPSRTGTVDSGIREETISQPRSDSGSEAPSSSRSLQSGEEPSPQSPEQSLASAKSERSSTSIRATDNPAAILWEQRSYNAAVQGNFDQAIENATKAIELDPGRVNPYINRSWAYLEKNMLDAAIQDCEKALLIDPRNAFAYNNRGLVYQRKDRISDAEKDYRHACDLGLDLGCQNLDGLSKQSRIAELIDQSQNSFNAKDWDNVIRLTTDVIQLDPENAVAYTNRSAAYAQKDFLNKALKDSNQAIKFNPDFPLAYNNRGYVLELIGDNRKAAADYLKSCSLGLDLGCKNFERLNQSR